MHMELNRRTFLTGAGGASIGAMAASIPSAISEGNETVELPWPYTELDVEVTRKLGHTFCYETNCASGTFLAIISQLHDKIGAPYSTMPLDVFDYGGGGVAGWGTLCGALNGASGAITLVAGPKNTGALVNELMGWYTGAAFPSDESNNTAESNGYASTKDVSSVRLPQSVSLSPLCHVSVSRWCSASQFASGSPERGERCARLAGDVAAKAVTLLNEFHTQTFNPGFSYDDTTKSCLACHAPGPDFSSGNFTLGKMSCVQCHEPHDITKMGDADGLPGKVGGTNNFPGPVNLFTDIQFSLEKSGMVQLEVYNIYGRKVKTLLDGRFQQGIHRVRWDGSCDDNSPVTPGTVSYTHLRAHET